MIVGIEDMLRRFGPPLATIPGQDDEIMCVDLRQQLTGKTHEHARMYSLLRLHLRYPGNVLVSTLHDTAPTPEFNLMWRFIVTLADQYHHAGTEGIRNAALRVGGSAYPATRVRITRESDIRLDGIAAHIPDHYRTVVVLAPPERLDGIHLEWSTA